MKLPRFLRKLFPQSLPSIEASPSDDPSPTNPPETTSCSVLELLEQTLIGLGFAPNRTEAGLTLPSGIQLEVALLDSRVLDNGVARTTTQVVSVHPTYFPQGLTEFQHSAGSNTASSLSEGFANWAKMDLVALEDAVLPKPQSCSFMEMTFPSTGDAAPRKRQVIFGPTGHVVTSQSEVSEEEDHPFCPCCLFTNSSEAFRAILDSDTFAGIRLFASKDFDGEVAADCRVNGEEFSEAQSHLQNYVNRWPKTFRTRVPKTVHHRTIGAHGINACPKQTQLHTMHKPMNISSLLKRRQLNVAEQNVVSEHKLRQTATWFRAHQHEIPQAIRAFWEAHSIDVSKAVDFEYENLGAIGLTGHYCGLLVTADQCFWRWELELDESRNQVVSIEEWRDVTSEQVLSAHMPGTGKSRGLMCLEILKQLHSSQTTTIQSSNEPLAKG